MTGSGHELALLRLVAQRVVGPPAPSAADAVAWLTAVQAQDLPGAQTSIALRTRSRSRDDVVAAFDDGSIVRTWPMRGTLHVVPAPDAAWMVDLMTPRPRAAAARRRVELGLDDGHLARAEAMAVTALSEGDGLTRAELIARWDDAGLPTSGGRGYHLLGHLAQCGVVCFGPMRGKDQLLVLLDRWVPSPRRPDRDEALGELALRYLRSHGPATVQDLMRWTGLPARDVRAGVALAAPDLAQLDVDGTTYHLDPRTPELLAEHRDEAREVLLLPGFDEIVLGYADRTATVPAEHADRIVPGGNGVFRPTVLHDGVAVGTWRAVGKGAKRTVEAEPFTRFAPRVTAAIPARFAALP